MLFIYDRYALAQEHGDLINLHDWYQSFKATICLSTKSKQRLKQSPSPKKRKSAVEPQAINGASLQYPSEYYLMFYHAYKIWGYFLVMPCSC